MLLIAAALFFSAVFFLTSVFDLPEYADLSAQFKESITIGEINSVQNGLYQKVNINTATKEELKILSGIGDVKAQAIIEYRETNGKFRKVEEIVCVDGIGEKILKENYHLLTV